MAAQLRNAGVQPSASRDHLGGWLHSPSAASDKQAQNLACRFRLSPWIARDMARLCFGEGGYND